MEKAQEIIQKHNLTALLVTHHLKDALRYGNRLLMMKEGVIVEDYSYDQKSVLTFEELAQLFD